MKSPSLWAAALACACVLAPAPARAAAPPASKAAVEALLARLDHDRFVVRHKADQALRAYGKAILPVLHAHLAKTKSCEVRHRLQQMIADLNAEERVAELIRQLSDHRTEYRTQADWQLRRYGKAVVPLLRKELSPSLEPERRQQLERLIAELSARR
jgi:hypothetical protein